MYVKKPFDNPPVKPDDRRAIARRHLIYYLRVWDRDNQRLLGHVADISAEGLMLVGEEQIPPGREYDLEMRLPSDDEGNTETLRFRAASRWSSNDINPALYDTGFLFVDTAPTVVMRIHDIIDDYAFDR